MTAEQPIGGTGYFAPGWSVWKYPDEETEGGTKSTSTKKKKTAEGKHPLAGRPHKVAGLKEGENYVLMFRDLGVQEQINQLCGEASVELMGAEQRGETMSGPGADDPGMLTNERLNRVLGADEEIESNAGRSTAVHGSSRDVRRTSHPVSQ